MSKKLIFSRNFHGCKNLKRVISIITVFSLIMALLPIFDLTTFAEGEIIEIATLTELEEFASAVNGGDTYEGKTVILKSDIDMSAKYGAGNEESYADVLWTPIGIYTSGDEKPFCGTFDGNEKSITGLYISGEQICLGLFGYNKGTIKNISVSGSVTYTGSLDNVPKTAGIAALNSGTLENCSFEGSVSGANHIGGIAGQNNGNISGCINNADVTGCGIYAGGIAGNNTSMITECKNYGEIQSESDKSAYGSVVGGIAGQNFAGGGSEAKISDCDNYGNVSGVSHIVGGIVGHNSDKVENCRNHGTVTSPKDYVGGIVGGTAMLPATVSGDTLSPVNPNDKSVGGFTIVKNCFNEGSITGRQRVGGMAGYTSFGDYDWNGYIADCGNMGNITGLAYIGGIVGYALPRASGGGYLFHDVIERCYNTGAVTGDAAYVGGIVGISGDILRNCFNTGSVTGGNVCVGGLAGMNNKYIKWGYNLGVISDGGVHGEIVGGNPAAGTVSECYYLDSSNMAGCGSNQNSTGNSVQIETLSDDKFTSGELAYNLQHSQIMSYEDENGNTITYNLQVWGQKLHSSEADEFPVLTSSEEKTVYKVSFYVKDDPAIIGYSNRIVDSEPYKPSDNTFMHWTINKENEEPFDFTQPISADTEFYAVFGAPKQVIFNANSGTWSDGDTTKTISDIPYNSAVGEAIPDNPNREHYIFEGWYTAAEGGEEFTSVTAVTYDMTIYAHWKEIKNTVTFNANSDAWSEDDDDTTKTVSDISYNSTVGEFMPINPSREGYIFKGWYTAAEGGEEFTSNTVVTDDMTIYAHWEEIKSTVTFNASDGAWGDGDIIKTVSDIPYNSAVGEFMPDNPSRDGYIFKGWFTEGESGTEFTNETLVVDNITVYANWAELPMPSESPSTAPSENPSASPTKKPHSGGGSSIRTTPKPTETSAPGNIKPSASVAPGINTDEHIPYIIGYPDGEFKPDNSISRAEVAAILARLAEDFSESEFYKNTFPDVFDGEWYSDYIGFDENKNVIYGYPDGEFKPDQFITRAEFAAMIARYTQLDCTDSADYPFSDTKQWAYAQIVACNNAGYIVGYEDNTFRPEVDITRAEAVTIINRVIDRVPNEISVNNCVGRVYENIFADVTKNHWGYYNVLEAAIKHNAKDFH